MTLEESLKMWTGRGYRLLPLNDGRYLPAGNPADGASSRLKAPLIPDWRNKATSLLPLLSSWARRTRAFGLLTGQSIDGGYLYVIDCDVSNNVNGVSGFLRMAREHGDDSARETFCVETPSGGRHFWYASKKPLGNTGGKLGPGIDTRGLGGYVGMPGSQLFIDGSPRQYRPLRYFADILPLPDWIYEAVAKDTVRTETRFQTGGLKPLDAPTWLSYNTIMECLTRICNAPKGQRNAVLYTESQRLARFTPRYISAADMAENCIENGCLAGLDRKEASDTVRSAFYSNVASMKVFFSDDPDYEALTGIRPFPVVHEDEKAGPGIDV